ncbi:50S ribosomal protein L25 [Caldicellulosiruptoraceae bacterium PP1]
MSTSSILNYSKREVISKGANNALRKNGYIMSVLYGSGIRSIPGYVSKKEFESIMKNSGTLNINLDGQMLTAIVKEIQRHFTTGEIVHLDFQILNENKKIFVDVPLIFENMDLLRSKGYVLQRLVEKIKVEGLIKDIPEHFSIDLSLYNQPTTIKVSDIKVNDNIKLHDDMNEIVAIIEETDNNE